MKTLLRGLATGMFLQMAVGPVFFYILSITLNSDIVASMAAVLGVVLADFIYIGVSILGIETLFEHEKMKKFFGIPSALLIIVFGAYLLFTALKTRSTEGVSEAMNAGKAFTSSFVLTIGSPLTIFFWSGIFTAKALERNFNRREIALFGVGAGLSTLIFLGITVTVISLIRKTIPDELVSALNILVASVMIGYGIYRIVDYFRKAHAKREARRSKR